ncbi:MAG: RNA polymerase-binding transcription factor DksA [Legionellaceae bacterium]
MPTKKSPIATSVTLDDHAVINNGTKETSNDSLNTNNDTVKNKEKHIMIPYVLEPDEEYMNSKQREHFLLILKQRKYELMEEAGRTVHHMQDEAANFPDPNDRATQEEEFSIELRTRDRERKLIKKIEEAIQKIENDDYGYCDVCGIEIGIRRLEARPTANLCIDCKTIDEMKERQMGSSGTFS